MEAMKHLGAVRLETERLVLRPFTAEDGEAMYRNWANDPEVTRYLTWQPHESPEASRRLAELWARDSARPDFYQWAIVLRELDEPIGSISVVHIDEALRSMEMGYCIGRAWWGQGLTAEALAAVIRFLVRGVGANRICARHDAANPNSGRVMAKAGMRRCGVLRASFRNNRGEIIDMVWYDLLAGEI